MIQDLMLPFISTLLAELGDKTQLTVLCLSTKTKQRFRLLMGIILAFVVADGLAILLGKFATGLIPELYIKLVAGIVFIIFGIVTILNRKKEEGESCDLKTPFLSGFGLLVTAEMGDKTQIAAAMYAAEYNAWLVFLGVMLAMTILSVIALYMGTLISKRLNKRTISVLAGTVFILIGMYTVAELLI